MTDEDIRKIAKHMVDARLLECMPSRDKIQEVILGEIRRQAFGMYDREARVLAGETTRSEIRKQMSLIVSAWIETNVVPVLSELKPNAEWLTKLITDEAESIRAHIKQMVREETGRLISQAIGVQISSKVAKLLALFDKVLVQE